MSITVAKKLIDNEDIILASINDIFYESFNYASDRLKSDKNFILKAVKKNSNIIKYINEELKKDREILLEAVKYNGLALEFILKEFQNDREIVLSAVQNIGQALHYASEELQNDREFILQAVKQNGLSLQFVCEKLQNDSVIVFEAVSHRGIALKHASKKLKNDKKIVLQAIKYEGYALEYASKELRSNYIIVFEATKNKSEAYREMVLDYASEEIQKNYNYLLSVITYFKNIENGNYDDNFIINNQHLIHLVENKTNLYKYLLDKEKYDIIYKNEDIHEYIKRNLNILILYLNDFDPENEYNEEQLKELVYKKIFGEKITIIFIKFDENFNITFIHIEKCELSLEYKDEVIQNDSLPLEYKGEKIHNDVLALEYESEKIQNDSLPLEYESEKIQNDVLALKYINEELKNDNFNNIEYFLNKNINILYLVKNKSNLCQYLLDEKKYDIIYKNEEIHEYIKIYYNILILSLNDLDLDNIYNKDRLKLEYQKRFKKFTLIFIR